MNSSFDIIQLVKTLRQRKRSLEDDHASQHPPELGMTDAELQAALAEMQSRHATLVSQVSLSAVTEGSEGLLVAKLLITAERLVQELADMRAELAQRFPDSAEALALFTAYEAEQLKVARLEVELSKVGPGFPEGTTEPSEAARPTGPTEENPYLSPGHLLRGRYKVAKILGRGGTGAVYGVTDQRTPQVWALKELWSDNPTFNHDQIRHQLYAEVRVLSALRHPNLPRIVDAFEEKGRHYIVMDYVEGQTLAQVLSTHKLLPVKHALEVGVKLASVLSYLHSQEPPIIFRDLKPANIMVREDGDVRLVDFGIARYFAKGASNDTQALGTPGYAAPEQYGGGQSDQRSDVYALGANLHQMLTGINPGLSPFRFEPVRTHCPEVSPEFEKALAQCVELDQARRPQNVSELRDEILAEIRRRNGGVLPAEMQVFAETGLAFEEDREPSSVLDSGGLPEPLLGEASDEQVEPVATDQVDNTPARGDSLLMEEARGSSQPGRTWQAWAIALLCLLMLAWILSR